MLAYLFIALIARMYYDNALAAIPVSSCTIAHEVCFTSTKCRDFFHHFQKVCRMRTPEICIMVNSYDCWQTWQYIQGTSLSNCTCSVQQDKKCKKIQTLINYNPCIKKLESILSPEPHLPNDRLADQSDLTSLFNNDTLQRDWTLSQPQPLFYSQHPTPHIVKDLKRFIMTYILNDDPTARANVRNLNTSTNITRWPPLDSFLKSYLGTGGSEPSSLRNNSSLPAGTVPTGTDQEILAQLRLQEDAIWLTYMAHYLHKTTRRYETSSPYPPSRYFTTEAVVYSEDYFWTSQVPGVNSSTPTARGADQVPVPDPTLLANSSRLLRNDSSSVPPPTPYYYDDGAVQWIDVNGTHLRPSRHQKRSTGADSSSLTSTSTTISLFDKLQNLTLSTDPSVPFNMTFCSGGGNGSVSSGNCWSSHEMSSYRNPIYLKTTPMSIEDLKCTNAFSKCNQDSQCFHGMSDMLSACTFAHKELEEDESVEADDKDGEVLEGSKDGQGESSKGKKRQTIDSKQRDRRKPKVKGSNSKDKTTEEPMSNDAEAKIFHKKPKKKQKTNPKKPDSTTEGSDSNSGKKKVAATKLNLVCDRVVCMGAIRNFYQQTDPFYTHPLVFCTCDPSDNACLKVREAISPPCASHPPTPESAKGSEGDSSKADAGLGGGEGLAKYGIPSCLEIRRLCQFDFFCNDHMENYRKYCKMSSGDGKCREDLVKCREARIGLMGTELLVHNCTCDDLGSQDESSKSNCLDLYQMLFENTCLEEAALDYVSNPIVGPTSTTISTTTITTTTETTSATTAIPVSLAPFATSPGGLTEQSVSEDTRPISSTIHPISDSDGDCTAVYTQCSNDAECGPKMEEMLSVCSTSGSCDPTTCKQITATFYHTVDPYYTYAAAFCQCTPKDKTCFALKEVFESRCVMISSLKTSCIQIYEKCSNNSWCHALLKELETNCMEGSDEEYCANGEEVCRNSLIKIKGSELMLKKCLCDEASPKLKSKCQEYFKIMVNNTCIDYSIKSYYLDPIKKLKTFTLPQFPFQTTQVTVVTTKIEHEKIPLNCSAKIHPDDDPIYVPLGTKVRVYAQKRDCSRLCNCLKENELQCVIIPCLPSTPCIRKFAIYGHGAPTYVAFRGYCLCFMGKILCVKPDPDKFAFSSHDKGLYISIGYSSQEFSLLERVTQDSLDDLIPRMQNVLTTDKGFKFNKTRCALSIFHKFADNIVIEAKLAMQNDTRGLRYRDKQCIKAMQTLSYQINNNGIKIVSDPLLSILKLSEVFMRLPEDDISFATSLLRSHSYTHLFALSILASVVYKMSFQT